MRGVVDVGVRKLDGGLHMFALGSSDAAVHVFALNASAACAHGALVGE